MAKKYYVGVDVGGTKISAGLVTHDGEILGWEKASTPRGKGGAEVLRVIVRAVKDVIADAGIKARHLRAIGIGVPGLVDSRSGRVTAAPNVPLVGVPISAELERRFDAKVAIGNDVNLGVLGEQWQGVARGLSNVVGIFPGTGVGGGVIAGGKLLLGAHGAAAELGHIVLDAEGPKCGCGAFGCLEAYASRTAMERDIRAGVKNREKSDIVALNGGRLDQIKSKVLARALRHRDPLVSKVMRGAAEKLGDGCVAIRHCFDPELIILGGGVIEACGDFILPIVKKRLEADRLFSKVGSCKVVRSRLGDDAVVLGAVALARSA